MTWFKVDDGFYDHPKVIDLPLAAVGLWALAGAYCARHLTDGVITDRQIRAIGGTRKQAAALVAAGLWSSDDAPPSTRRFAFNDWGDFQPTREEVEKKRAEEAERKRQWRDAKAAKQGKRQNVPAGQTAGQTMGRTPDVRPESRVLSALPDPTRPDPTRPDPFINTASSSPNGEQGDGKSASQDFHHPPELGPTVRRLLAAGHDPTVVEAAVAAWDARPAPKGPGLLPHLLADAEATIAAAHAEADRRSATHARLESVRQCPLCDEAGHIVGDDGAPLVPAIPCTHQEDTNAELVLAARERIEAQEAAEAERRAIAAKAAAEARARWKRDPNPEPQEVPSGPF